MCGIFGYVGKDNAKKYIINGLKRLEYRGYDSWGVAVVSEDGIKVVKMTGAIGELKDLDQLPDSHIGIGHTRWATHGGVTNVNAHPHYSTNADFVLAQNGIVENYQELKQELISKGYKFESQTDTEVIVRLIEDQLSKLPHGRDRLFDATRNAFLDLKGRNTIIVLSNNADEVIAIRNGSPLVVGVDQNDDQYFFASDTLSFADYTDKVMYLNDYEMVRYFDNQLKLFDVKSKELKENEIQTLDHEDVQIDKQGYDHFMLKEIVEQQFTIKQSISYSYEELLPLIDAIKKANIVYTVGAGTANFAAGQIAYYLREFANIKAIELKSYEIDSYRNFFDKEDLIIAVSQSGETADTLEALEIAKSKGIKVASIVNMLGSTTTRISDYPYFSRTGPEVCVASTKAFTAQIAWGLLLAMSIVGKYEQTKKLLTDCSDKLAEILNENIFNQIKTLVEKMTLAEHFFILGKGQNYYIALEGALKIKEITYKHFEGFAAGELKHGVIALIEKNTPVISIVSNDDFRSDMMSATAEVKARGAWTIGITKNDNELFDDAIILPDFGIADAIINVIAFQLISYFLGIKLGNSPDKPRNLAKSVTVK
jgi:glutamine---fructose-6-phosphate transaminase (isomerizing)